MSARKNGGGELQLTGDMMAVAEAVWWFAESKPIKIMYFKCLIYVFWIFLVGISHRKFTWYAYS